MAADPAITRSVGPRRYLCISMVHGLETDLRSGPSSSDLATEASLAALFSFPSSRLPPVPLLLSVALRTHLGRASGRAIRPVSR
jgi:hypothetical protein